MKNFSNLFSIAKKFSILFLMILIISVFMTGRLAASDASIRLPSDTDQGVIVDNIDFVGAHYTIVSSMTCGGVGTIAPNVGLVVGAAIVYGVIYSSSAESGNFLTVYDSTSSQQSTNDTYAFTVSVDTNSAAGAQYAGGRMFKLPVPVQMSNGIYCIIGDEEVDWKASILYRKMRE